MIGEITPSMSVVEALTVGDQNDGAYVLIDTVRIADNPRNPRKVFDAHAMTALASSIREVGLLQPILVRPLIDKAKGTEYEVVAGSRRLAACKMVGLAKVPVRLAEMTRETATVVTVAENAQRKALRPSEEARGYALLAEQGLSLRAIATRVGVPHSTVQYFLAIAMFPPDLQLLIDEGGLPSNAVLTLAPIKHPDTLRQMVASINKVAGSPWNELRKRTFVQAAGGAIAARLLQDEVATVLTGKEGWYADQCVQCPYQARVLFKGSDLCTKFSCYRTLSQIEGPPTPATAAPRTKRTPAPATPQQWGPGEAVQNEGGEGLRRAVLVALRRVAKEGEILEAVDLTLEAYGTLLAGFDDLAHAPSHIYEFGIGVLAALINRRIDNG